jgi:hypothetical protein
MAGSCERGNQNVIFQHPVALYRSDFGALHAIYEQRRSLLIRRKNRERRCT